MNNKIKDYLGVAIIAAMFVFAYAAVNYTNAFLKSIQPSSFRSFSVSAEGKIVAIPDVAQFSFSVKTEGGKNIADLQKENTEKTNKSIEFIKSNGVETKDIKTTNYSLEPRYQYYNCSRPENNATPCPPPDIVGYTVNQTISVKIRDFKKIGDVIAGIVENGANEISSLSFVIDDQSLVQDQAKNEAIVKAKAKAISVAKAGGFRIGRLLSIEEGGYSPLYRFESLAVSKGAGGDETFPSPAIEPGSQEITTTITLRYEIR
ncbi:MAG: SIMPL domain-containing protein [Patescibacteria group bacterium]